MRRAGANPTDVEILEIVNKIDGESGTFDFPVELYFVKENDFRLNPDQAISAPARTTIRMT